jgi:putative DNA modification/repair radical SAM protein
MDIAAKLAILADAAKYDASCASSGTERRNSRKGGIGSTTGSGICHSYTPDGRCVSLLKILLTNFCSYDCLYCINRRSSNVPRARFTIDEVVALTLDFYRRNYIEGLFLSSGIIQNADYTMEQVVAVARKLRREHGFKGYIHLKTIPEASSGLIAQAGQWADRVSINVELPEQHELDRLAPEKNLARIEAAMGQIRTQIETGKPDRSNGTAQPRFAPAGQSTQMIVGATQASDAVILDRATSLYSRHKLKRVYYSAFSPIPDAASDLPLIAPPLVREHRLYQADWLLRFYGFKVHEIADANRPYLDLERDPKLVWAESHPEFFPVNINRASLEILLRVPGLGVRTVRRLLAARRWRRLQMIDLRRLRLPLRKALPFIETSDYHPRSPVPTDTRNSLQGKQLDLFEASVSALNGEF